MCQRCRLEPGALERRQALGFGESDQRSQLIGITPEGFGRQFELSKKIDLSKTCQPYGSGQDCYLMLERIDPSLELIPALR